MPEPDYRALFVETMARLMAIQSGVGDMAGVYHVRDLDDLAHWIEWTDAMHAEKPDWELDDDPINEAPDDAMFDAAERSRVYVDRLKRETVAYHDRLGWHPWWRDRQPHSSSTGEDES